MAVVNRLLHGMAVVNRLLQARLTTMNGQASVITLIVFIFTVPICGEH